MSNSTIALLSSIAVERWGMFTTAQATAAGVTRKSLSGLANAGAIERVAQGVYRMAGSPAAEIELDRIRIHWLALGGAMRPPTDSGVPALVAVGRTAARIHQIGDWFSGASTFIVPERRATRLSDVRLRVGALSHEEVAIVDGLPAMTVERTIADLIAVGEDVSLVAGAASDAARRGSITSTRRLAVHLDPFARSHGHASCVSYAAELLEIAGGKPNWATARCPIRRLIIAERRS